ncbi:MAG: hypothetical protein CBC65_000500 [Rhodothermaceae bacterium TMED105]|nr:MAG: hypothetical protein CBC65_000500 [Rhodothermaceae bacterium TMED105]
MVGRRLSVLWIFGALTGAVGRASRDNTSHAILAPPHRLALCLTGLINHGEPNGVTGPNLRAALRRPEQLERLGKWLTSIRALNVKVDIFLTLELNDHPKKHPVVSSRARMIESEYAPVNSSLTHPVPPAVLVPILTSLQPVRLSLVGDEAPFCTRRQITCACSKAFPRWWEQISKARMCSDAVGAYERQKAVHYDAHLQMRSDLHVGADASARPSVIMAALDYAMANPTHVFLKPYAGGSSPMTGTFGQADWYWLAARPAAVKLMSVVDASCAWQYCTASLSTTVLANERLLVRWALRHGLSLSTMNSPHDKRVDASKREAKQCNMVEAYEVNLLREVPAAECITSALHVAAAYHNLTLCCKLKIQHEATWALHEDELLSWRYYTMCDSDPDLARQRLQSAQYSLADAMKQLCSRC